MSILMHHAKVSPAICPPLTFAAADDGFRVADNAGAFAGTIDQHGTHYYVRNGFGEYLGDYATLSAAQHALAAHTTTLTKATW